MSENTSIGNTAGTDMTIAIKGEQYTLTTYTLGDLADFEGYVKSKRLEEFRTASDGMDEKARLEEIARMVKEGLDDEDLLSSMNSMSGVCFLLHRALRKHHPELSLSDVGGMIDLDNLDEISTILQNMGGTSENPTPADSTTTNTNNT